KILALLLFVTLAFTASAQIYDPVSWKFGTEKINDKEAVVTLTATMQPGWHVYSQFIEEGGPIPTSFKFDESADFSLVGGVTESPKAISAFDPNFKMQIAWHKGQVKFSQKIALRQPKVTVSGVLEFMTCNDTNCLPPEEIPFSINIDASKPFAEAKAVQAQAPAAAQPVDNAPAEQVASPAENVPAESNLNPGIPAT